MLSFFPSVVREILSHLPTVAFKTVPWPETISQTKTITTQYLNSVVPSKVDEYLNLKLNGKLKIIHQVEKQRKSFTDQSLSLENAEIILSLYFWQIKNPHGFYLDLRPKHFYFHPNNHLDFFPVLLFTAWNNDFGQKLFVLYESFYTENMVLFSTVLDELGLTKGLSQKQKEKLRDLFLQHFGHSTEKQIFKINDFQKSFMKIFDFFIEHKIHLPVDFIFLGVLLLGLYQNLEKCIEPVNVKKIFLLVKDS